MKIIVAADWHGSEIYAEAFKNSFDDLGCETYRFSWKEYFHHYQYPDRYVTDGNKLKSFYYRLQNKLLIGPSLMKLNYDLVELVKSIQPDLVFIYRGSHIYPATIKKIRETSGCKIFGYNNDDPFSPIYPAYIWRLFKRGINLYDHIFSYRLTNIQDYNSLGYKKTSLLRSYYTKDRNFPLDIEMSNPYCTDVIFIGHFEDDGRDKCLFELLKSKHRVKIFGTGWESSTIYNELVKLNGTISPIYEEYNLALNSAKIALVFLSKLNRDTYTRRCFEIPATCTFMLAEYTSDLASLFEEGIEAEYFRNKDELLRKVNYYLDNESYLQQVALNGYNKNIKSGNDILNRAKQVLEQLNDCNLK